MDIESEVKEIRSIVCVYLLENSDFNDNRYEERTRRRYAGLKSKA